MLVVCNTDIKIFDKNGHAVQVTTKGKTYNAEKMLNGYIILDDLKQNSYFIEEYFFKTFSKTI